MLKSFLKILLSAYIGAAISPMISLAQINMGSPFSLESELGVEIVPEYPRPNEQVSVSLTLYTDDLNSADITWYKDGKIVSSGKGKVDYSFTTGPIGEETKIDVQINLLSGSSFSKTFTLNPSSVDLVWEADSYVPPFYKGKALHSRQGSLKIVAMPEFVKGGRRIPPENLIYKWSSGLDVYEKQSGYGKNVLLLNGSILGQKEKIEVLVTDPVNNLVAHELLNISPVYPQIVFYKNDPYYGHMFDSAINGSLDLKTDEVQVIATPYFFTRESEGLLKYEWRLNGTLVPDLYGSRTAIFRKPEGQKGQSSISLRMENLNRILQQADGRLSINFEDQ